MEETVEDVIEYLYKNINFMRSNKNNKRNEKSNKRFIFDIKHRIDNGEKLTNKQFDISIKIIRQYDKLFEMFENLENILIEKKSRNGVVDGKNKLREASYIGSSLIAFKISYNPDFIKRIKDLKVYSRVEYNSQYKVWLVFCNKDNVKSIVKLIDDFNIYTDEETDRFIDYIVENKTNNNHDVYESFYSFYVNPNSDVLLWEVLKSFEFSEENFGE